MDQKAINKRIKRLEAVARLFLQECHELRNVLTAGDVSTSAKLKQKRKVVSDETIANILAKVNARS